MSSLIQFLRGAGKIGYDNASSGLTATTVQAAIDEIDTTLDGAVSDISDIRTLTGTADGETNLGTFTGSTISDNTTIKNALQELETSVEGKVSASLWDANTIVKADSDDTPVAMTVAPSTFVGRAAAGSIQAMTVGTAQTELSLDHVFTLTGVAEGSDDLGTFTGVTIPDSSTIKAALQSLETAHEETDTNVDDLVTLSGVAENSTDLGTFTGVTIPDSSTVKSALQSLETAHEGLSSTLNTFEWQNSALDYITDNTAVPPTETSGDRYVLAHDGGAPNAAWDGASAGDVVEFNGTTWDAVTPTLGTFISVDDANDRLYYWGGSSWAEKYFEATTASTGLTKVGFDIRLDASAAGAGLGFAAGVLSVNVDDSTLEINTDTLRIKDLGVTTAKLAATSVTAAKLGSDVAGAGLTGGNGSAIAVDFSTAFNDAKAVKAEDLNSTVNGRGASIIGVEDAGSNWTSTNVEGVLDEIDGRLDTLESATTSGWQAVTSAHNAADGQKLLVDTTGGAITVTLPSSPSVGDEVIIRDSERNSETNDITVARNGSNIGGLAEDMTFGINGMQVHLVYASAGEGWSVEAS